MAPGTGRDRTRGPARPRSPEMTTITIAARYARYLLTSLATVAFGYSVN
jgi:hypothetical protein